VHEPLGPAVPPIDADLVARLVADQFPEWAGLRVTAVSPQGWDNRTFRIGDELSARLPSAEGYASQVVKEQQWLPHLAAHLPVPVPEPVALGRPAHGYPYAWSVSRWLEADVLSRVHDLEEVTLAEDLAAFLVALRRVPAASGPPAGPLTAYRGAPLNHYADEARRAFRLLDVTTAASAEQVLDAALATRWEREPVWFHGDFAVDNILVRNGRMYAVLDFGCAGVGDPACDLAIAFIRFDRRGRDVFRRAVGLDDETWRRARGWSVWKAAITLIHPAAPPLRRQESERALAAVLEDCATDR
jgi:aminoglycoside phosphotransferase (APT) family kinase protein